MRRGADLKEEDRGPENHLVGKWVCAPQGRGRLAQRGKGGKKREKVNRLPVGRTSWQPAFRREKERFLRPTKKGGKAEIWRAVFAQKFCALKKGKGFSFTEKVVDRAGLAGGEKRPYGNVYKYWKP